METSMSDENDEVKKLPTVTDAPRTDGFEDGSDEDESRVIQGKLVKFTNEATWEVGDGEELPPDLELIAISTRRVVQKWKDGTPIETIILTPGEKWPDIGELNEAVPKKEWEEGPDGTPRGPFQAQYIVYLLDPKTMDAYTWPTGTVGGGIAVRDLIRKVKFMREYRGERVYAVVTLADVYMSTRFGGRQRPHLAVQRWITFGDGDKVLPAPDTPKLSGGAQEVKPPSAAEVTEDSIPF
jgi:hypothetical protein